MPKHFVAFLFPLLLCACGAAAQDLLPARADSSSMIQAPQPAPAHEPVGFWTFRSVDGPALRTNREAFHDKTWRVAQTVWLASIVYDVELTKSGLSHHRCVEKNIDPPFPRRSQMYISVIPEYVGGTLLSWAMLRFVGKPLMLEFPAIGTAIHLDGGTKWLMDCW
jgi:hypothetical protein